MERRLDSLLWEGRAVHPEYILYKYIPMGNNGIINTVNVGTVDGIGWEDTLYLDRSDQDIVAQTRPKISHFHHLSGEMNSRVPLLSKLL